MKTILELTALASNPKFEMISSPVLKHGIVGFSGFGQSSNSTPLHWFTINNSLPYKNHDKYLIHSNHTGDVLKYQEFGMASIILIYEIELKNSKSKNSKL